LSVVKLRAYPKSIVTLYLIIGSLHDAHKVSRYRAVIEKKKRLEPAVIINSVLLLEMKSRERLPICRRERQQFDFI
jgi:hypothetical protein